MGCHGRWGITQDQQALFYRYIDSPARPERGTTENRASDQNESTGLRPAPAYADQPDKRPDFWQTVFLDLKTIANGLWVYPDTGIRTDGSRHFRFSIIPNEYTGPATLEILIETPEGQSPEPVAYTFDRDEIEWPIADYVYRNENHYFVYLPDLEAHRKVEFSLGLTNTSFASYRVTALLTVDNGQKSASWEGWHLREIK